MERIFPSLIYVIDDDADDFDFLKETINEKWPGVRLVYISDPTDFISLLDQLTLPGMVILDVNMPQMTGFEVFRMMVKKPVWSRIPVVFLTTSTDPNEKARSLAMGAAAFLTKPASIANWSGVVDSLLKVGNNHQRVPGADHILR